MTRLPAHTYLPAWVFFGALAAAAPLAAQDPDGSKESPAERHNPIPIQLDKMHRLHVTTSGRVLERSVTDVQGSCVTQISAHTNADFAGGTYIVQGGFAEQEIAAASFVLDPGDFPLRVDLMEMIFATFNAQVQTTTEWSVLVWEGTPATGNLVAQFSSDDKILPHIVLPPGTNGIDVAVSVDPGDPEQIIVSDNGSHTLSFGYRIDHHNQQTSNPCTTPPPSCCNAFPTTDVGGLASPTGNWLNGVNCGIFGCPPNGGWATFQQLPGSPGTFCTPSGDWVMRITWTPFFCEDNLGACCLPFGACQSLSELDCNLATGSFSEVGQPCSQASCGACCFQSDFCEDDLSAQECANDGGAYQGGETVCAEISCPEALGACCLGTSCFDDTTQGDCINPPVNGQWQGPSTQCGPETCLPSLGACCLPSGGCLDDTAAVDCAAAGGAYKGNNSTCGSVQCTGACCFGTTCLSNATLNNCSGAGGTWMGPQLMCGGQQNPCLQLLGACCPGDGSACTETLSGGCNLPGDEWAGAGTTCAETECSNPCPPDFDNNGTVNAADLAFLLGNWGPCPGCQPDLNGDDSVNAADLAFLLGNWGPCP